MARAPVLHLKYRQRMDTMQAHVNAALQKTAAAILNTNQNGMGFPQARKSDFSKKAQNVVDSAVVNLFIPPC